MQITIDENQYIEIKVDKCKYIITDAAYQLIYGINTIMSICFDTDIRLIFDCRMLISRSTNISDLHTTEIFNNYNIFRLCIGSLFDKEPRHDIICYRYYNDDFLNISYNYLDNNINYIKKYLYITNLYFKHLYITGNLLFFYIKSREFFKCSYIDGLSGFNSDNLSGFNTYSITGFNSGRFYGSTLVHKKYLDKFSNEFTFSYISTIKKLNKNIYNKTFNYI